MYATKSIKQRQIFIMLTTKKLEKEGINQISENLSSNKDLIGTLPKQNYDLVNKYMKRIIHDKMKTFKSEPTSN